MFLQNEALFHKRLTRIDPVARTLSIFMNILLLLQCGIYLALYSFVGLVLQFQFVQF